MDIENPQGIELEQTPNSDATNQELPTDVQQTEDNSLPDNATERTKKEFSKLLSYNKELKKKIEELESIQSKVKTADATLSADPNDYIDEDGNIDISRLNADLKAMKSYVLEAKILAENANQNIEVEKAVTKHPYLDPASELYDAQFTELVKDRLARLKLEGKETSLSKVADEVSKVYRPQNSKVADTEQVINDYKKSQVNKANVGTLNSGRNIRVEENLSDLRKIMYGSDPEARDRAIQQRIRNAGL